MSFNRAASGDAVPRIASSYLCFPRQQSNPISGYLYLSNERAPRLSGDGVQSKWSIDDMVLYVSVASIVLRKLVDVMFSDSAANQLPLCCDVRAVQTRLRCSDTVECSM
jgi:chromosome condensin MukBEF MukE localization factor